jgi:hypothetical protein
MASIFTIMAVLLLQPPVHAPQAQPRRDTSISRSEASHEREFFVSPRGRTAAAGTRADPWDLATALKQPPTVQPGDTIWLLGGKYGDGKTYFISQLTGRPQVPVIVRQFPGERATIDGSLIVNGAYAWYWGFEVTSSVTDRTGDHSNPAAGTLDGVEVNGPYTKFINLVVHDTREGFGVWTPAEGAEVYGSIVYNNGWQGPDRGHGHGIYTQNQNAQKHLGDNIIFNQFGVGIHAYGSAKAFVQNYLVDRNIVFNNGALSTDGRTDNILFGVGGSLAGLRFESNYTYHTPSANIGTSRIGWSYGGANQDVVLQNNYFIGGYISLEVRGWTSMNVSGNTFYSATFAGIYLQLPSPHKPNALTWDENTYYGPEQFYLQGQRRSWDAWRAGMPIDAKSKYAPSPPAGVWSFVNPNAYEPGRGNIVIYNWDKKSSVEVDVSPILQAGANFEVRDAENFFSPPVLSGAYKGGTIRIPMTGLTAAQPNGAVPNPPRHTAPEFGAFVVIQH